MRNTLKTFMLAGALSLAMVVPAFAGSWQQDTVGYWYKNDDGTYPANCWRWIDGNNDGIAESYYFNESGYLVVNTTTPDNYTVDANGAWTVNGIVQTQAVATTPAPQQNTQASTTTEAAAQASTGISASPYDGYTIVANTNTLKYHTPTCRSVKDIKDHNRGYSSDASLLESQGYQACKICH